MGELVGGLGTVDVECSTPEKEYPELLGLQATVHPDGAEAMLMLHMKTGDICIAAKIDQVSAAHMEIRSAAVLMQHRQCMNKDGGESSIASLMRSALRPITATCVIDPATGDRFFILQFADRLPIAIRMTPEQVLSHRASEQSESRRMAN